MLNVDLTQKEIGRLTNGYYKEDTLHKLIKIDYSDCQRWEDNAIFRQFLTKTVGTTPGHWKAPKAIQSWAVQLLAEHLAEQEKTRLEMIAEEEAFEEKKAAAEKKAVAEKKAAAEKKATDISIKRERKELMRKSDLTEPVGPSGFAFHDDDLIAF
ncbi:hypothetical protein FSHL1_006188 [Fusarium sambucinum]